MRIAIPDANADGAGLEVDHGVKENIMNRFLKHIVLSAAIAATTLTALAPAEARDRWNRHGGGHHYRYGNDSGNMLAAGVAGLALGAIVGGVLASDPPYRSVYDEPYREPVARPRPVRPYYTDPNLVQYRPSLEPWTPEWYSYCSATYRSFDAQTGTYMGYDGQSHFCVAN